MYSDIPYADITFALSGGKIPLDHGYYLYSAIANCTPNIHGQPWLSIHSINGVPDKQGNIKLIDNSRLRLRIPVDKMLLVYTLAGKRLNLNGNNIRLYTPEVLMLRPQPKLRARIVVISNYSEPEPFLEAATAQLARLNIIGDLHISSNLSGGLARRVIRIKERVNVGFGVETSRLQPEDSLKLQQCGLGGKHRMGCGIFTPLN